MKQDFKLWFFFFYYYYNTFNFIYIYIYLAVIHLDFWKLYFKALFVPIRIKHNEFLISVKNILKDYFLSGPSLSCGKAGEASLFWAGIHFTWHGAIVAMKPMCTLWITAAALQRLLPFEYSALYLCLSCATPAIRIALVGYVQIWNRVSWALADLGHFPGAFVAALRSIVWSSSSHVVPFFDISNHG